MISSAVRSRSRLWLSGFVALLMIAGPARAEDDTGLAPGDTAFGQEKGDLELAFEAGFTNGVEENERELRLGLEYGLTDRVQLGFELPYLFINPDDPAEPDESGLDAAQIGLQLALLGRDAPFALSCAFEAEVPVTGRAGPGSDETKLAMGVLLARVWGSKELFGDAKVTRTEGPTQIELQVGGIVAKGRLAFELAATWTDSGTETEWDLVPELIIEDLGPFDLGLALPYTFLHGTDEWGGAITLTWGFP